MTGVGQSTIGVGELDRIQVLTLDVLDDGQLEAIRGRDVRDDGGDGRSPGELARTEAPLAHDQLVTGAGATHDDGLQHAVLRDRA